MKICALIFANDEELLGGLLVSLLLQERKPDEIRIYGGRHVLPKHFRWHVLWWASQGVSVTFKMFPDVYENRNFSFGGTHGQYIKDALEESRAEVFWILLDDTVPSPNALKVLEEELQKRNKAVMPVTKVLNVVKGDPSQSVFEGDKEVSFGMHWGILIKREWLEEVVDDFSKWIVVEDGYLVNRLRPYVSSKCYVLHIKDAFDYVYGVSVKRVMSYFEQFRKMIGVDEE